MLLLKKYYKANSIIESVIALTIISICIYIAIMVYANVFSPKTSIHQYSRQNKINEQFYLLQLQEEVPIETHIKKNISSDEMKKWVPDNQNLNTISEENIETTENWLNTYLKKVTITYKDSLSSNGSKTVYIHTDEE